MIKSLLIFTTFFLSLNSFAGDRTVWRTASGDRTVWRTASLENSALTNFENIDYLKVSEVNNDGSLSVDVLENGVERQLVISDEKLDKLNPVFLEMLAFSIQNNNSWIEL